MIKITTTTTIQGVTSTCAARNMGQNHARFEVVAAHADLHCSRAGEVYTFVISASKFMSLVSCWSSCFHSKPRLNCNGRPSLTIQ
eukprot:scaffold464767_cov17-Prasinocladus_malaysianus.AAC.2